MVARETTINFSKKTSVKRLECLISDTQYILEEKIKYYYHILNRMF